MFTFGIFSTHFPYIAVVVFYAYFFIFGANKASTGEIQINSSEFKTELHSDRTYTEFNDNSNFYYQNDFDFYTYSSDFKKNFFKRKIKYQSFFFAKIAQSGFNTVHFSRPPPSLI